MINIDKISILGTGWLGLPLAQRLKANGAQLKLATRSNERFERLVTVNKDNYQIDIADLSNSDEITAFLDAQLLIINITNFDKICFQHLIELIEHSPIKYLIYISSTTVYINTQSIITEADKLEDPDNAIFQIEQLFKTSTAFNTTIIRMSGLVDSQRHPGRFFKSGKVLPQAKAPINLIHLDDCLNIIETVIDKQAWNETFNACSITHPDKKQFYTYARSLLNDSPPKFSDDTELKYKIISSEKIQQQLGYQFIHPDLMNCKF